AIHDELRVQVTKDLEAVVVQLCNEAWKIRVFALRVAHGRVPARVRLTFELVVDPDCADAELLVSEALRLRAHRIRPTQRRFPDAKRPRLWQRWPPRQPRELLDHIERPWPREDDGVQHRAIHARLPCVFPV